MRILDACVIALIAGIATPGAAQVSQASMTSAPTGAVTGRVFCSDTQLPGRFAEVALLRKSEKAAPRATAQASALSNLPASQPGLLVVYLSSRSHLDGTYTIRNVPPGDYFVVATMDGYVVPISPPVGKDGADDTEVSLDDLLPGSPVAHVTANQTTQVDVTMGRGGAISGRVLFDDGTPVVRASIQVQPAKREDLNESTVVSEQLGKVAGGRYQGTTDDQGRYRLAGLEPGKYRVLTTIHFEAESQVASYGASQFREGGPASGIASELRLYQPGTFRRSEAKVFEIKGDEEDTGEDIAVPIDGLHSVAGRVLAKSDGHVPTLALVTVSMDNEVGGYVHASADGSFRVDYLPKGTYTVTTQASDYEPMSNGQSGTPKELRRYERTTTTVVIGEHDAVMDDLLVVEAKPK